MTFTSEDLSLYLGCCLESMKTMEDNSIDSIVTDPPYGLSFMGKAWDYDVPRVEIWKEALRVLKPGGHLLAFAGTRTQHRMAVNIEDAGFEIRDMISWVYGSGFPKSHNISKAIDKRAGAEREVLSEKPAYGIGGGGCLSGHSVGATAKVLGAPATPDAVKWDGWGTAIKPAVEPITVARKPFRGTVADNVLKHGTGGVNIDGCRVGDEAVVTRQVDTSKNMHHSYDGAASSNGVTTSRVGRFPANFIHDGSPEVVQHFPGIGDKSAARFFYVPKASKKDRGENNSHPTIKPTDLMRYLCRLVTPAGGVVLDPFMGSGSTGKAAALEGFRFVGCELSEEYFAIAEARIMDAHL